MLKDDQLAARQIVSGETGAKASQEEAIPHVECALTASGTGRPLARYADRAETWTLSVFRPKPKSKPLCKKRSIFWTLGFKGSKWLVSANSVNFLQTL